jgi:hypothetical protein
VNRADTIPSWDRWYFLTEPYDRLLELDGFEIVSGDRETLTAAFLGRVEYSPRRIVIHPDVTGLEREYVVRGLLAARIGIDITDWPVAMLPPRERAR